VETLTIGELARGAGVNVETVRYYERRGLIDEPPRSPSGYRQYSDDDLWRLQFIGRAKRLGFTLAEIRDLIGSDGPRDATDVLDAARTKVAAVEQQQRALSELHLRLQHLVELCEVGDPCACTALDVIS
jgi:MerR family transcriptional regulator, mercuric resistance operon regulatory protein